MPFGGEKDPVARNVASPGDDDNFGAGWSAEFYSQIELIPMCSASVHNLPIARLRNCVTAPAKILYDFFAFAEKVP
jgi:hypothetical protein